MTTEAVTVEMDMAIVHEGRQYKRGDRLAMTRGEALDLQALAFAHVVEEVEVPRQETESGAGDGDQPEPRPTRTVSRNRYLRRDRRDEGP